LGFQNVQFCAFIISLRVERPPPNSQPSLGKEDEGAHTLGVSGVTYVEFRESVRYAWVMVGAAMKLADTMRRGAFGVRRNAHKQDSARGRLEMVHGRRDKPNWRPAGQGTIRDSASACRKWPEYGGREAALYRLPDWRVPVSCL